MRTHPFPTKNRVIEHNGNWEIVLELMDGEIAVISGESMDDDSKMTQDEMNGQQNLTNQNYYDNKQRLLTDIESAEYAVSLGTDIRSAQNALDDANYLRNNQNDFF